MTLEDKLKMCIENAISLGMDLQQIENFLKVSVECAVSSWGYKNGWTLSSGKWERVAPATDVEPREGSKP